jgi:hypothetical protein
VINRRGGAMYPKPSTFGSIELNNCSTPSIRVRVGIAVSTSTSRSFLSKRRTEFPRKAPHPSPLIYLKNEAEGLIGRMSAIHRGTFLQSNAVDERTPSRSALAGRVLASSWRYGPRCLSKVRPPGADGQLHRYRFSDYRLGGKLAAGIIFSMTGGPSQTVGALFRRLAAAHVQLPPMINNLAGLPTAAVPSAHEP